MRLRRAEMGRSGAGREGLKDLAHVQFCPEWLLTSSVASIPRLMRLECSLKAWSFQSSSKPVLSLCTRGLTGSVFYITSFTNSQLIRPQVWTKLDNSEDISSALACSVARKIRMHFRRSRNLFYWWERGEGWMAEKIKPITPRVQGYTVYVEHTLFLPCSRCFLKLQVLPCAILDTSNPFSFLVLHLAQVILSTSLCYTWHK